MRQRRARELCKHGDAAALKGDEGLLPATKAGACRATGQVQRCSEGCSKFTPAAELRARRPPSEGRKSSGGFHREVRTCSSNKLWACAKKQKCLQGCSAVRAAGDGPELSRVANHSVYLARVPGR